MDPQDVDGSLSTISSNIKLLPMKWVEMPPISPGGSSTAQREIPSNRCCPLCSTHYYHYAPLLTLVSGPSPAPEATGRWIVALNGSCSEACPALNKHPSPPLASRLLTVAGPSCRPHTW
jgi:hypothetical protein